MSSVRRDLFTGAYVIIAETRGKRPIDYIEPLKPHISQEICPFCPGNEASTPRELFVDNVDWQIRSFPNKYPALTEVEDFSLVNGFYGKYDSIGEHEVLVDTREHEKTLSDFSERHIQNIFGALKSRYKHYYDKEETKYIQIFKNCGYKAGASQTHSHWQIVSGRFIPSIQEAIGYNLKTYYDDVRDHEACLYCDMIKNDLETGKRIIFDDECFAVIAPYASRFTYETWIIPKKHHSSILGLDDNDIINLSKIIKKLLVKMSEVFENLDYNILLMDSPKDVKRELFHWHIQIIPRMGNLAGYEFSTGSYLNHISPEEAAEKLKLK